MAQQTENDFKLQGPVRNNALLGDDQLDGWARGLCFVMKFIQAVSNRVYFAGAMRSLQDPTPISRSECRAVSLNRFKQPLHC